MKRGIIQSSEAPKNLAQGELGLHIPKENDRNFHLGGRSFYFFDFDDNVAYLTTPIVVFHKETGEEKLLSSFDWAQYHHDIGKSGPYANYMVDYNDQTGSFRYFRDQNFNLFERLIGKKQTFIQDIEKALKKKDFAWKAPSWNCFYHATYNRRPISVITARGHQKKTLEKGIKLLHKEGYLPNLPNFLSIFPVTNPEVRGKELNDQGFKKSVADLKKVAIRKSVEKAIEIYGNNPHHRFGMSDDDPKNIELIREEMKDLKKDYPEMSFFVIQTFEHHCIKTEILKDRTKDEWVNYSSSGHEQLNLF